MFAVFRRDRENTKMRKMVEKRGRKVVENSPWNFGKFNAIIQPSDAQLINKIQKETTDYGKIQNLD